MVDLCLPICDVQSRMAWIYLVSLVLGYLLGSFPTGYLVGRWHGIDIREHGSGNIGATNVVRVLGKRPGYLVFLCDAIKGLLSVRLAVFLIDHAGLITTIEVPQAELSHTLVNVQTQFAASVALAGIIAGLACILGHNFPVWLRFRGGKGVATTVGVLVGLMPGAVGIAAIVWIVCFLVSRYVSLSSLLAATVLPVAVWWLSRARSPITGPAAPMFWFSIVAALLIFLRHRANIGRLLHGTEPRFDRKPAASVPPPAV